MACGDGLCYGWISRLWEKIIYRPRCRVAKMFLKKTFGIIQASCGCLEWWYASHPQCNKSSAVAEMGDRLATIDMGRRLGAAVTPLGGGAGSPSNTMWQGNRPTSVPSGILIYSTVWPQYTNVSDRQDRQRSDSIGRTVLQTLAQ